MDAKDRCGYFDSLQGMSIREAIDEMHQLEMDEAEEMPPEGEEDETYN